MNLLAENTKSLTVSQLNREARGLLEGHFGTVWVEGEISNYTAHRSGHWYFSLKDNQAQVRCAMFKGSNQYVRFNIEEGMQIKCLATVSLYEGRGDFQLIVRSLEPLGDGALQKAFEELKKKLHKEGLFAETNKKTINAYNQTIAILSSPTGAAIRDMITTFKRRNIGQTITLYPCEVQGNTAAKTITTQLKQAIKDKPDIILIARGGGSLEDLWAFNDETLARAIYASPVPIISGVGHEIDFTICDFVSDLRAATPTAAAELASPDPVEFKKQLLKLKQIIETIFSNQYQQAKTTLNNLSSRLLQTTNRYQQLQQRSDHLLLNLNHQIHKFVNDKNKSLQSLTSKLKTLKPNSELFLRRIISMRSMLHITTKKNIQLQIDQFNRVRSRLQPGLIPLKAKHITIKNSHEKCQTAITQQLKQLKRELKFLEKRLQQAAPQTILNKGYSIIKDHKGQIIKQAKQLKSEQAISIILAKGSVDATINKVND